MRLGSAFLAGAFVSWEKHDLEISYPSRISVPSRGFCFLAKTRPEKILRLGSAFLAGALVFWENTTWKKVLRLGSAFLAGAFVFWEKHDLEKSCPSRISVPSRGSCFLGKHKLSVSDQRS